MVHGLDGNAYPWFETMRQYRALNGTSIFLAFSLLAFALTNISAMGQTDDDTFTPSNPPQMRRLTDFNSPAWQEAKLFMHGVNLGNYLEAPPDSQWGVTVSAPEFDIMKREGFDHVRIPIGWQYYTGPAPDYALSPEIFSRVDFAVTNALAAGLAVIINIHDFDDLDQNPEATTDEFLKIWNQIARYYKKFPNQLAFELDNEPHANATTAIMNPIYARAIKEIRRTNPRRTIFVEPGGWGSITELKNLVLPSDNNVIVSVHSYEPFMFTHQGATWAGPMPRQTGIQFPGPPATPLTPDPSLHLPQSALDWIHRYNTLPAEENPSSPRAFEGRLKYVREWSDYYGRPVHLGEFGCFTKADPDSRARLYTAYRKALAEDKIGWAIWDWSAGFRYWNKAKNRPVAGMREALFGTE
ncbi:MAG TPA: glycoside hydrolase family 5 protein [Alphaproteobacteria bacterium]|nr:glycoside hydrolase family 5 protein [Alphaproteobacteria bacterium]